MTRLIPLLIAVTLLTGCIDKREVCAQASAGGLSDEELRQAYKDLGIKKPYRSGSPYSTQINRNVIRNYCEYYRR